MTYQIARWSLAAVMAVCLCSLGCTGDPGIEPEPEGGADDVQARATEPSASTGRQPTTGTPRERIQTTIDQMVELCEQADFAAATPYFIYRGDDEARRYADASDPTVEEERQDATRGCEALLREAFPSSDAAYHFGQFEFEEESEGVWYSQWVTFPDHPDADPVILSFLEIDGMMVLGDMD